MLGVNTIRSYSHVGSQALVDVFSWKLFPDGLQGDFQFITRLQLEFIVLFQHGVPDVIVQWVQIWRARGPLILPNKPVRIQSVLHDAQITLRNGGRVGLNSVIFRYIPTKLGDKWYT